ncbi:sulfotransferase family 2 domain-containing protein [Candidatus Peregrinibacteria bacterium]|jgi:hypothetical protein|nr:sulfotransferase family 2 domain-containing protein [Candidatus Peregrinibacteria bacterium]MBT7703666.1 sulfotransferase family 2 domain-containing protein [Candidatus Peregrinibacteria bacterium]
MPISHDKKFIFIHLVKTAGDSIEKTLDLQKDNELYGFEDKEGTYYKNIGGMLLSSIRGLDGEMTCLQHLPAIEIKKRYPKKWDSYFKFGFVRNPWDVVVSLYSYITQSRKDLHKIWEIDESTSFHDFVMNAKVGYFPQFMFLCPQCDFLMDKSNKPIVDFIGRFENLENDFQKVCEKIEVTAELRKTNSSKHKPYQDYYDEKTKVKVADIFAKDIEYFKYKF